MENQSSGRKAVVCTDPNASYSDMHDFSISSIISDYSHLLDARSSSSFLVRVGDRRDRSISHNNNQMFKSLDGASAMEADVECPREANSWNSFDRVMEKSMVSKELEIHEFEEFVQKNNQSMIGGQDIPFDFISGDAAQAEFDKEEEDRAQFLKAADASFVSTKNNSTFLRDPMSMTNYFKHRSSFPLDVCANESTMIQEDTSNLNTPGTFHEDLTLTLVSPTARKVKTDYYDRSRLSCLEELEAKKKQFAEYLIGSESDGAAGSMILNALMEVCKRESEAGRVSPSPLPRPRELPISRNEIKPTLIITPPKALPEPRSSTPMLSENGIENRSSPLKPRNKINCVNDQTNISKPKPRSLTPRRLQYDIDNGPSSSSSRRVNKINCDNDQKGIPKPNPKSLIPKRMENNVKSGLSLSQAANKINSDNDQKDFSTQIEVRRKSRKCDEPITQTQLAQPSTSSASGHTQNFVGSHSNVNGTYPSQVPEYCPPAYGPGVPFAIHIHLPSFSLPFPYNQPGPGGMGQPTFSNMDPSSRHAHKACNCQHAVPPK